LFPNYTLYPLPTPWGVFEVSAGWGTGAGPRFYSPNFMTTQWSMDWFMAKITGNSGFEPPNQTVSTQFSKKQFWEIGNTMVNHWNSGKKCSSHGWTNPQTDLARVPTINAWPAGLVVPSRSICYPKVGSSPTLHPNLIFCKGNEWLAGGSLTT
jgi:hypothetical protein